MSWQGKNLFLTPLNDCINDCIRNWTQNWDPGLMMSTGWSNHHHGISAMLSGGTAGLFCEPSQGNQKKVAKPWLAPKGTCLGFSTFPIFGGKWSNRITYFDRYDPYPPKGPNIQAIPGIISSYSLVKWTNGRLYNLCWVLAEMNKIERLCELAG